MADDSKQLSPQQLLDLERQKKFAERRKKIDKVMANKKLNGKEKFDSIRTILTGHRKQEELLDDVS